MKFWLCVVLLVGFAFWGLILIAQDYRTGEIGSSFIHRPLLIFHEAGHVVFRLLGEWMMMLGGSLGQFIMPVVLGGVLLVKNRDPFGAAIGLWLLGVSLLDVAPYMYDALHPNSCCCRAGPAKRGVTTGYSCFRPWDCCTKHNSWVHWFTNLVR